MYILNLETATRNCSASVAENGITLFCKEIASKSFSHAELLHRFINEVLLATNLTLNDLSAVAISKGPGSYTGLRIGVSAAKGLCYALEIPLISVDTLAVLASQIEVKNGLIIPMIDARRMEVYSATFNNNHKKITETKAIILDENIFSAIDETVYFIGDSNEKAKTVLIKSNFVFLDNNLFPSANEMSALSFEKFLNNDFEDVASFEPYYLKDFLITTSAKS